jgi:hypothetical protein
MIFRNETLETIMPFSVIEYLAEHYDDEDDENDE